MFLVPLVELEERRRGLEKLQAAYKALTDEFWTEEGPSYFDVWGRNIETSVSRIYSLSVDIGTAESLAERMAVKAREQVSHRYSNAWSTDAIFSLEFPHVLISEARKPVSIECSIPSPGQGQKCAALRYFKFSQCRYTI